MIQPTVRGRKLPRNDWEGDDFTPGAGGRYVTCLDTSVGRMVAYATNGRTDFDGRVYRAAISPRDPDGITLVQANTALWRVANLGLVIPRGWVSKNVKTHLRYARGLIIAGKYSTIPRAYRYQPNADFNHSMFVSHRSEKTGNFRVWDPLNPDIHGYGRWIPETFIWRFIESLDYQIAYVPLQHL